MGSKHADDERGVGGELPQDDLWMGQAPGEGISGGDGAAMPEPEDVLPNPIRDDQPAREAAPLSELFQGAHEAHSRFQKDPCRSAAAKPPGPVPSQLLNPSDPKVVHKLEHLDDLVYDAVAGKADAMDDLRAFWPQVRDDLGDQLLAESQEQYLRYALSTWVGCVETEAVRDPSRAIQSLEVLCVLFDEV